MSKYENRKILVVTADQHFAARLTRLLSGSYTIVPYSFADVDLLRDELFCDCPSVIVTDCHGAETSVVRRQIEAISSVMYVSGHRPAAVLVGGDDLISVLVPDDGFFGCVSAAEEEDGVIVRRIDMMAAIQQIRYGEGRDDDPGYPRKQDKSKKLSGFVGYMRDKLAKLWA